MELREAFEAEKDVVLLYVLVDSQVNDKTVRFIDGLGLRDRVRFLVDDGGAAIDTLGVRLENPEPMEEGVPLPTTYLLDRNGRVRFVDVRRDYHIWLDASVLLDALAAIP